MFRFMNVAIEIAYGPCLHDVDITLLELGALSDAEYTELVGYDRHGNLVLRDGETLDGDDGWAGDLDPGMFGGDAAGAGGNYE